MQIKKTLLIVFSVSILATSTALTKSPVRIETKKVRKIVQIKKSKKADMRKKAISVDGKRNIIIGTATLVKKDR